MGLKKIIENITRKFLKETYGYDEEQYELSPFEEYERDYPGSSFDASHMTPDELAEWCSNVGDFLYIFEGFGGLKVMNANTRNIVKDIVGDLYECERIEPTHEVDYLIERREDYFIGSYVCVFKLIGTKDGDYYVIYMENKYNTLNEGKKMINESFNSNELRGWFKLHGGVKKTFAEEGYPDTTTPQDALSDVSDDDIRYLEEFSSFNDAVRKRNRLMQSDSNRMRSKYDMECYFTIYRANDGMCLLVGIDRKNIDLGITWGGEVSKRSADRFWNKEHNPKTDGYQYSRKGKDFGIYTNKQFKGKAEDNARIRSHMSDKEWKEYQNKRVNDMDSYLRKYYGKGLKENVDRLVREVLKESIYENQWEDEIRIFFEELKKGNALVEDGYVAVEYYSSDEDPRYIYYKEGEDHLTDDHFSMQNSRRLDWDEISMIRDCAKNIYGVDIYIPDDEYWDEVEGENEEW